MADTFEELYIKLRDKEGRVLNLDEIKLLPKTRSTNPNKNEWLLRKKTTERFSKYLQKNQISKLLEIGCGNGWFSNYCSKSVSKVVGIDVNHVELDQAKQAFPSVGFYFWDIFTTPPFKHKFDLIVLNAVIQYFPDFEKTIKRLQELLNPNGEIHIIDSPFYSTSEIPFARKRTHDYYSKMGVPEMSKHYFHHDLESVKNFDVLYKPNKIKQLLLGKDSPFCWLKLKV